MSLTPVQRAVYEKMEAGQWYSASKLGCRISTLTAIRRKLHTFDAMLMPGMGWLFRKTYGRE
jgi:hypothetical protein